MRPIFAAVSIVVCLAGSAFGQTITGLSPNSASVGGDSQTITVSGNNLDGDTNFWVNCSPQKATAVNGKVTLTIDASLLTTPSFIPITTAQCINADSVQTSFFVVKAAQPKQFHNRPPLGQTLVGFDVAAASSTSPSAVFLALGSLDIPFYGLKEDLGKSRRTGFWGGGQIKIAGMAQPGSLSGLPSLSSYVAPAFNATPDKIVQSIEGSAFLAFQFERWRVPGGTFDTGTPKSGQAMATYATASFIVNGGAVTPLSISQANPPIYTSTPQIQQQFSNLNLPTSCSTAGSTSSTCYVAFVPSDRMHFYRHYEAGFRFKLYAPDYDDNELRYPGILDITVGQNEYVTGGQLNGVVVHIGGTLPVPYIDGLYAFGSMDMGMYGPSQDGQQLILQPAASTANVTLSSTSVTPISVLQPNRDRYSFGFGIDFAHLYSHYKTKNQKNQE